MVGPLLVLSRTGLSEIEIVKSPALRFVEHLDCPVKSMAVTDEHICVQCEDKILVLQSFIRPTLPEQPWYAPLAKLIPGLVLVVAGGVSCWWQARKFSNKQETKKPGLGDKFSKGVSQNQRNLGDLDRQVADMQKKIDEMGSRGFGDLDKKVGAMERKISEMGQKMPSTQSLARQMGSQLADLEDSDS